MKKLFTTILVVFAAISAFGQKKGEVLIGGSLGFSATTDYFQNNSAAVNSSFNISVKSDYFFIDNLATGLGLGFETAKDNSSPNSVEWTNAGSVFANVNYYLQLCPNFYWTPGIKLADSFGAAYVQNYLWPETITKQGFNTFEIALILARFEYRINQHFSVFGNLGNLGFRTTSFEGGFTENVWNMNLNSLLALNFGFSYWF